MTLLTQKGNRASHLLTCIHFRYPFTLPVGAFHKHIRLQPQYQLPRGVLLENHHLVNESD